MFSKFLNTLACEKQHLCLFYNGGCGNDALKKYEKIFLDAINGTNSTQAKMWERWHSLANNYAEELKTLQALEEQRKEYVSGLKKIQSKIRKFYKEYKLDSHSTARAAFEHFGEYSQIEDEMPSKFFKQREDKKQ